MMFGKLTETHMNTMYKTEMNQILIDMKAGTNDLQGRWTGRGGARRGVRRVGRSMEIETDRFRGNNR